MINQPRIIVALDYKDKASALSLLEQLDPKLCQVKVGMELYTKEGPAIIQAIQQKNFSIFLDLKFFDIPTTVAKACSVVANLGVSMLTLHILGGKDMLEQAVDSISTASNPPLLLGVTLLTSWNNNTIKQIGLSYPSVQDGVLSLAQLAESAGIKGLVCSAQEARFLRSHNIKQTLVTPGIRFTSDNSDDQDPNRIATPKAAIEAGADYLVIGRSITQAENPQQALEQVMSIFSN